MDILMIPYYTSLEGLPAGFYVDGHVDMTVDGAQRHLALILLQLKDEILNNTVFDIDGPSDELKAKRETIAKQIAWKSSPKPVYARVEWDEEGHTCHGPIITAKYAGLFEGIPDHVDPESFRFDECNIDEPNATAATKFEFDEGLVEELSEC